MFGNANRRRFLLPRRGLVLVVGTTMDLRMLFVTAIGTVAWRRRLERARPRNSEMGMKSGPEIRSARRIWIWRTTKQDEIWARQIQREIVRLFAEVRRFRTVRDLTVRPVPTMIITN